MSIQSIQNLPREISRAARQIEDAAQLERRISEVWLQLQTDRNSLSQSRFAKLFLVTTPENDLVNILAQLQPEFSGNIYDPKILEVRQELKKYPNLEKTELTLIVLESLLHGNGTERARMHKVWAELFSKVNSQWQFEVGRTAEKAFLHLFRVECANQRGFSGSLDFLEVVGKSLGADYRQKWISHCAEELTKENYAEFYAALPPHSEGGETAAELRRELSFRKFLKQEEIEGYQDLKAILERSDEVEPLMWERLLELIADSKFADLKREAWGVWLKQSKNLEKEKPFGKVWVMAVRLLKEADDAAAFYKSDIFKRLTTPPEGLSIYDQVYTCACKSAEDLSAIHQDYMRTYATVREQRARASLAKLNERTLNPFYLNGILDDLEKGIIDGGEVWCKVLDKAVTCNSTEIKKRTWAFWCLQHAALAGEKSYRKIWLEAIKLLTPADGLEFFCGNFAAVLQFLIEKRVDGLSSIYQTAANSAKRSVADIPRIVEAHQKYVDANPLLKNSIFFEISIRLVEEKLNQPMAYRLIQYHVQDNQADTLGKACQWFQERLKRDLSKAVIPAALELAGVLLELSDKYPVAIPCYAMAEKLNKASGFQDLALRFAFKALHAANKEDLGKKANQRPLEACIDLMTAILPHASDSGFLNLLQREKIQDFQNCHSQKKRFIFWKEMLSRSLSMPPEFGVGSACDFWKFLKDSEEAEDISGKMVEAALAILPVDSNAGIENYEEVYKNACVKLFNTFQEKITYKIDDDGHRVPVIRTVDLFIAHLYAKAGHMERHSFLLLSVACNLMNDSSLKDFVENKLALVGAKHCLEQVDRIKGSASLDTPGVQSFLHAARELLHAKEIQDYVETLKDENLNNLIAIEAPALFKVWLEIEKDGAPLSDDISDKFNEPARSVFRANGSNLRVQKLVWKFAIEFAVKHIEQIPEPTWGVNLKEWMGLIDEMLAAGFKGNRVSLRHLDDVIEICDFAAPLLSEIASKYEESAADQILSALMKMADLQINYSSREPVKKKEALSRLVDFAIEGVTDIHLDRIIQLAMDAERRGPLREMAINSDGVKIDGSFSATDDEPALKRKGVTALFSYLLQKSSNDDLFFSLELASQLLKRGPFEDFQNEDHCIKMMQIFSDVITALDEYEQCEIFDYDIFINVFHALTHKPARESEELGSLEELIGTNNLQHKKKAQEKLNEIIGCFFTMCGENGKFLSKVTTERRLLAISSIDKFLGDCRRKQFLESEDLEKWEAKLALLRKQISH